jgi:hypothetical protein
MMPLPALLLAALIATSPAVSPQSSLPLAELPTQVLAENECALVLWERGTGKRIAMLTLRPETIRIADAGGVQVLPKVSAEGEPVAGFSARMQFSDGKRSIMTSLAIVANDVAGSAIVRDGIVSVTGLDGVEVVASVAGIAGCNR